jgi:hypothetical protein
MLSIGKERVTYKDMVAFLYDFTKSEKGEVELSHDVTIKNKKANIYSKVGVDLNDKSVELNLKCKLY